MNWLNPGYWEFYFKIYSHAAFVKLWHQTPQTLEFSFCKLESVIQNNDAIYTCISITGLFIYISLINPKYIN
jgi:hypothetical protein